MSRYEISNTELATVPDGTTIIRDRGKDVWGYAPRNADRFPTFRVRHVRETVQLTGNATDGYSWTYRGVASGPLIKKDGTDHQGQSASLNIVPGADADIDALCVGEVEMLRRLRDAFNQATNGLPA